MAPSLRNLGGGAGAGGAGGAVADLVEGNGFDRARAAIDTGAEAIFGALPSGLSPAEIVETVVPDALKDFVGGIVRQATGGGGQEVATDAAGMVLPVLTDLVGVVV